MELMIDEKPLSPAEQDRLGELEGVIRENLKAWYAVGTAMLEIRESRLYRNDDGRTWEGYCREIFGMSHQHADRQIAAARVIENLTPIGVKADGQPDWELLPANEAQARELAALQPEDQRNLWGWLLEETNDQGAPIKVTAKAVKEAVNGFKGQALKQALKKAIEDVQPRQKADPNRESEPFKQAWTGLMEQVEEEGRNGWKSTPRDVVFNALVRLAGEVGSKGGLRGNIISKKLVLRQQNREKLLAAGWVLLRRGAGGNTIEQLGEDSSWLVYGEYEDESQCEEAFQDVLLESNTIQV